MVAAAMATPAPVEARVASSVELVGSAAGVAADDQATGAAR